MAIWEEISKNIKYRLEKMSELYSGLQAINHTLMIEDGLLFPDVP
jgi:glutaredoxin 2